MMLFNDGVLPDNRNSAFLGLASMVVMKSINMIENTCMDPVVFMLLLKKQI
jgi:hypothetical protein